MAQLVFLHGPGAGGTNESYRYQLQHFRGALAPVLPGHLSGTPCTSVQRYTDWVRGWLWAQERHRDLVLVGFTLGSLIALQYGLDYPEEVKGLVLMTAAMRPKGVKPEVFAQRLRAAKDPVELNNWLDAMRKVMGYVEPSFRDELLDLHRRIGPKSQHDDLVVMESFDVRDRVATLKPKLLLIQGADRHVAPGDFEGEIHQAVPGSKLMTLQGAGHFPMAEQPEVVNRAIEEFIATLG
jgi:4,5:9,10-diseco-3-hydroxy-5,9,17-trioxoandrosta-1(10),2-diene-4-oate hydrolase